MDRAVKYDFSCIAHTLKCIFYHCRYRCRVKDHLCFDAAGQFFHLLFQIFFCRINHGFCSKGSCHLESFFIYIRYNDLGSPFCTDSCVQQPHNTAADNQNCVSQAYLGSIYTVHHTGYRLNDTRFFRGNAAVLKHAVWRNQKIFTEPAHSSVRKAREMCTVVKMFTALFITALTVKTITARKCDSHYYFISNTPLIFIYFIPHLFDVSCYFMSSYKRKFNFIDSCINSLLPCADCRRVHFDQDFIS